MSGDRIDNLWSKVLEPFESAGLIVFVKVLICSVLVWTWLVSSISTQVGRWHWTIVSVSVSWNNIFFFSSFSLPLLLFVSLFAFFSSQSFEGGLVPSLYFFSTGLTPAFLALPTEQLSKNPTLVSLGRFEGKSTKGFCFLILSSRYNRFPLGRP